MGKKIEKNKYDNLTVYYANQLARMNNKFTLEEEKIMHLIIGQIKHKEKNPIVFKILKSDFFNKLELESDNRYPRYRKLIQGLINKTFIEITDKDGDNLVGVLITASKWHNKKSFFEVDINPRFMPFLEQLIEDYTKLNLDYVLSFNSKHTLTLYKWLCSWTNKMVANNNRYITTKDLKIMLGLTKDDYMQGEKFNRTSFEKNTINKAIQEINKKSNFIVTYKKNKKNNIVENYAFNWTNKDLVSNKLSDFNNLTQTKKPETKETINSLTIDLVHNLLNKVFWVLI